jgi:hypothetical protein
MIGIGTAVDPVAMLPAVGARDPATQPPMFYGDTAWNAILHWLAYVGIGLMTGSLGFALVVWRPALRKARIQAGNGSDSRGDEIDNRLARQFRMVALAGGALFLLANLMLFVMQALARGPVVGALGQLGVALWAGCSVGLLFILLANRQSLGAMIAALGVGLNLLVVLLNGGMPVVAANVNELESVGSAVAASQGFYTLADQRTVLPVLGDVLPAANGMASIGDVLLVLGVVVFVVNAMLPSVSLRPER